MLKWKLYIIQGADNLVRLQIIDHSLIYANFMCACAVVVNKLIVGQNNFRFKYGNVAKQNK